MLAWRGGGSLAATVFVVFTLGQGALAFAKVVTPCVPGEPAQLAALRELQSIDGAVRALAPGDRPEALVARIAKLVSGRCFATLGGLSLEPKSGLALGTYWQEGGMERMQSTLVLGGKGRRMFWTEPSTRRALTRETSPASPIAAMLCPAADETCGAQTAGWTLRAEAVFELAGKLDREGARREDRAPGRGGDCEAAARAAPRGRGFAAWRDCVEAEEGSVGPRIGFPIGHTRAPREGWLIVDGRRGHHDFCDEVRAYDLATGSAYVVGSCSALAIEPGGGVNRSKTDDARRPVIELGHLSLDYLREAAWMTLLLDELDLDVRDAVGIEIPGWLPVSLDDRPKRRSRHGAASGLSTDQTTLDWAVVTGDRLVKRGTLIFPEDPYDVPADHAMRLLRIAELSLAAGCPGSTPPAYVTSRVGGSSPALQATWTEALARQKACKAGTR
jgi:hypothetical protein